MNRKKTFKVLHVPLKVNLQWTVVVYLPCSGITSTLRERERERERALFLFVSKNDNNVGIPKNTLNYHSIWREQKYDWRNVGNKLAYSLANNSWASFFMISQKCVNKGRSNKWSRCLTINFLEKQTVKYNIGPFVAKYSSCLSSYFVKVSTVSVCSSSWLTQT